MIPDQIAHLIRLVASAGSEPEANTAARLACSKLLALVGKASDGSASKEPSMGGERSSGFREALSRAESMLEESNRVQRDLKAEVVSLKKQLEALKNPPRCINAKFPGKCLECGESVEEGERVWWAPGVKGVVCLECS